MPPKSVFVVWENDVLALTVHSAHLSINSAKKAGNKFRRSHGTAWEVVRSSGPYVAQVVSSDQRISITEVPLVIEGENDAS